MSYFGFSLPMSITYYLSYKALSTEHSELSSLDEDGAIDERSEGESSP
jgi:hypothetical protein